MYVLHRFLSPRPGWERAAERGDTIYAVVYRAWACVITGHKALERCSCSFLYKFKNISYKVNMSLYAAANPACILQIINPAEPAENETASMPDYQARAHLIRPAGLLYFLCLSPVSNSPPYICNGFFLVVKCSSSTYSCPVPVKFRFQIAGDIG